MSWKAAFAEITAKTHTQQTIWWLNGFWEEGADKHAEELWKITHTAIEIETGQKILYGKRKVEVKEGADLDEMKAHVFLEKMGETLTVRDLRKRLKELDVDNNNRMALSEYYLAKWTKTPQDLVNAPQGEGASPAEMADAQAKLDAAQNAMLEVQAALEESTALLAQAKRDEAAAKKALADSVQAEKDAKAAAAAAKSAADAAAKSLVEQEKAESELKKAEDELRVAVDALNAEEAAYQKKLSELEAKANDPALGAAKKGAAANELAQMKAEDPMPLRKAKITQGAALKRAEKARAPLAAATEAARQAKVKADQAAEAADNAAADAAEAKKEAERAARAAEESTKAAAKAKADLEVKVAESEAAVAAAEAVLAELKSRKGVPYGAIFWMERQMQEMQKFMPSK